MNKEYNDINKNTINSNFTLDSNSLTYNYYAPQAVLFDKYYKVNAQNEIPEKAIKELAAQFLNNKHEYNIQVTVDYLTIEVEDSEHAQHLCHVIIKSLGYNIWSSPAAQPGTILYNEGVKPGQPITTGTPIPQEGYYVTCDGANDISSNVTINKSSWNDVIKKNN